MQLLPFYKSSGICRARSRNKQYVAAEWELIEPLFLWSGDLEENLYHKEIIMNNISSHLLNNPCFRKNRAISDVSIIIQRKPDISKMCRGVYRKLFICSFAQFNIWKLKRRKAAACALDIKNARSTRIFEKLWNSTSFSRNQYMLYWLRQLYNTALYNFTYGGAPACISKLMTRRRCCREIGTAKRNIILYLKVASCRQLMVSEAPLKAWRHYIACEWYIWNRISK